MLEQTQSIISSLMVPKPRCLACLSIPNGLSKYIRLESSIKPNETQNRTEAAWRHSAREPSRKNLECVASTPQHEQNRHPSLQCSAAVLGKDVTVGGSSANVLWELFSQSLWKDGHGESDTHQLREKFLVNMRQGSWHTNPQRKEKKP